MSLQTRIAALIIEIGADIKTLHEALGGGSALLDQTGAPMVDQSGALLTTGGSEPSTTSDLLEGTNLYFTDTRARAAVITASITNGDTTHTPSGDAVFDALAELRPKVAFIPMSPVGISSITVPSGISTPVPLGGVSYDEIGCWSGSSPSRVTIPSGVSRVILSANLRFNTLPGGTRLAFFTKNGSGMFAGRAGQRISTSGAIDYINLTTAVLPVTAGDYFELVANQNAGSDATVLDEDGAYTWVCIRTVP